MNYNNSLKFSRYLKSTLQYDFAIEEYERLIFLYPNDSVVNIELAKTYRQAHKCHRFNRALTLLANQDRVFKIPEITKEFLNFSLICNNYNYFDYYASLLNEDEKKYYQLSRLWSEGNFKTIRSFALINEHIEDKKLARLYSLSQKFKKEKYKSPGLALVMSAIIPGSGKAYTNRWGDALMSLLFVSSNAIVSYRAFSKKGIKSTNGWLFGTLSLSFYVGNIWGSYRAAKQYNNHINHTYKHNAENIIHSFF